MNQHYSTLLIGDNTQGPGLEVVGTRPDGTSVRIGACSTLTLWELRCKLGRMFPRAEVYFALFAPDPEYIGRE